VCCPPIVSEKKVVDVFFPIQRPANHGRPLQKQTTYESLKNCFGKPRRLESAEVVLVNAANKSTAAQDCFF
jgi:hypothetical protein